MSSVQANNEEQMPLLAETMKLEPVNVRPESDTAGGGQCPEKIKIISLNCWGLKYISKYRHERLQEIGAQLAASSPAPDLVGLQECWTQQDYSSIRDQTKDILPYAKFYFAGIFGAGLAILSRWPIEESSMFQYPLNGRPTAFWRGDWYVGKGVACASIRIGPAKHDILEVFNTHLHAAYAAPNTSGAYREHRAAQAWAISKLIRRAKEAGHLVLALGDFNIVPSSLAYKIITTHGQVKDVWRELHPNSAIAASRTKREQRRQQRLNRQSTNGKASKHTFAAAAPHSNTSALDDQAKPPRITRAEVNLSENGTTCDSALNTWRWDKTLRKDLHRGRSINEEAYLRDHSDARAKRLDYIFLGTPPSPARSWTVEHARVGMTTRHPTLRCSLSDHFSVEATITIDDEQSDPQTRKSDFLPPKTYDRIHSYILSNLARSKTQRRWRLAHFLGSVLVSIGCLVAVWWSPGNYISFILMLVSTLGLVAGVVDGLIGGLFFSQEIRALVEWEWEVLNVRQKALQAYGSGRGADGPGVSHENGSGDEDGDDGEEELV